MAYYLGIDLGTTYTAAAIERDGLVEALTLGNRTASVPSVVFLRDDGEILVGEAATRRAMSEPGRVAREFKRRVGDPTPIILGGTPYAAEMLMARLLRWGVDRVREQQGADPLGIALTHPANWGPYKLDLLTQAVRQVDVEAALMLPEPVAAATFYASQRRLDSNAVVAVYDLGGGTFDAAIVRRTATGFEIIGSPEGIERLGGIDFDEAVYAHVRGAIGDALDRLDPEEPASIAATARLRQECIDAKEALSGDTDVSIPVFLPNLQTEVRLTRSEFEDMIRPAINETIVALRRSIRSAHVSDDEISAVLLVGGSSRIPLVAQMVAAELGRPIAIDAHPKDAISFGAAIAVAHKSGRATPESVTTVLPRDPRPPPPTMAPANHRPAPPGSRPVPPVGAGAIPLTRPAPPTVGRPAPPAARPAPPAAARPAPPVGAPAARPGALPDNAATSAQPAASTLPAPLASRPAPPGGGTPGANPAAHIAAPTSGRPTGSPAAAGSPTAPRPPTTGSPTSGGGTTAAPRPTPAAPASPSRPASGPTTPGGYPAQRPGATAGGGYTAPRAGPTPTAGYGTPRPGPTPSGGYPAQRAGTPSGGYPAQQPSAGDENRVPLLIAIGVVAAILVVILVLLATRGGSDDAQDDNGGSTETTEQANASTTESTEAPSTANGYTSAFQTEFLNGCTGVGDSTESECQCVLNYLVENVPIEDVLDAADPTSNPEIADAIADCQE